jgi:hypothetical protein
VAIIVVLLVLAWAVGRFGTAARHRRRPATAAGGADAMTRR